MSYVGSLGLRWPGRQGNLECGDGHTEDSSKPGVRGKHFQDLQTVDALELAPIHLHLWIFSTIIPT